jgi:hypothetical protein
MHFHGGIWRLIWHGKPGFNGRRRGRAGQSDSDDLAHRFLACFRKQ